MAINSKPDSLNAPFSQSVLDIKKGVRDLVGKKLGFSSQISSFKENYLYVRRTGNSIIKKVIYGFTVSVFFVCGSFPLFSQNYNKITLDRVIEIALEKNITVQSKKLDKAMYEAQADEVIASGLPQVNISAQFDDNLILPTTLLPAVIAGGPAGEYIPIKMGNQYNMSATASVEQLIYSHSFWTGVKAAKAASDLADLTLNLTKEQIVYNVSMLYYNINITDKSINNIKDNIEKLQATLKIMQAQEENGFLTKTDVKRVKVTITNLESELSNAITSRDNLLATIKVLMNIPQETELSLDEGINESEILKEVTLSENPYRNRTDLALLNKQTELYGLQLDNVTAGYYPSLSAYGRYSYQAMRQEFNFFDTSKDWYNMAAVGIQLKVPVFDGLAKKYRSEQSEIKLEQTKYDIALLKENVNSDVKNAKAKLKTSFEMFQSQKENIDLAQEVYSLTEDRYKEGYSPVVDLLNAETSLKEAQNNYLRSLLQINLAKLDLRKAEGSLIK